MSRTQIKRPDRVFKSSLASVDAKIRLHETDGYRVSSEREERGVVSVVMRYAPNLEKGAQVPAAGDEELQALRAENLSLKEQLAEAQDALGQTTSDLGKAENALAQAKKAEARKSD